VGIFNIDGPFYKFGSILADIIILGLLWFLLALPIVTIGASTSAVYYVFTKRVNGREGYVWSDFWRSFRQNFFISTGVWLTMLLIYAVLILNIYYAELLGNMASFVLVVQLIILVQATFITMYIFPLISRFEMRYLELFKTAFFLANRHILLTITNTVLLASSAVIVIMQPIFLFVLAGAYFYFSSFLFMRAFKKYRPDIDELTYTTEMAPLQLDFIEETVEADIAEETSGLSEQSEDETFYGNDSTVLNLERVKGMQDDKE